MTPITLFYSWQSDRDSNLCRHFIEKALERAVELVRGDGIALTIDADTRNVPGTPPVTATILKKIDACDIFFADMTLVGATDAGKLTPNPNVMGEYGYALRGLGPERILLAMNTAFGAPAELPFDLRHWRFPLQYQAGLDIKDTARRDLRADVGRRLAAAIIPIARAARARGQGIAADAMARAQELAGEQRAAFARGNVPATVSRPCLAIQLVPLAAFNGTPLTPRAVAPVIEPFFPPGHEIGLHGADERMWWKHGPRRNIDGKPNPEVDWMFTIVRPGVLEFAIRLGGRIGDDPTIGVEGFKLEAWIVRTIEKMLERAEALGLNGPAVIAVSLEGLEDVEIIAGNLPSTRLRRERILVGGTTLSIGETPIGTQLRGVLDDLWLAMGRGAGSPSFADDRWRGYENETEYRLP
ncbi:MAG: hypothetical protein ACREH4_08420 [Vitreimonas sp.]